MAEVSIAILGLDRLGASFALALQRYNASSDARNHFSLIAADRRPGVVEDARKHKIADNITRKLFDAVQGRDVIILALPYADVESYYQSIGPDLKPGVVILDTSVLKVPSLKWADEHLPESAHMVGVTPILNPQYLFDGLDDTAHAKADLFEKGTMLLAPSPTCSRDAIELASDIGGLLGATSHFFDPAEHDSLIAATEGLPALLGAATFFMLQNNAGWNDAQRLTNPAFGRLTHHLFDTHPDDIRDMLVNNRDNNVRYIDRMIEALQVFRSIIAEEDQSSLEAALIEAADAYSAWVNRRYNARWDEDDKNQPMPSASDMMGNVFGGFLSNRLRGKNDDK